MLTDHDLAKQIGRNVRAARECEGLSQDQAAGLEAQIGRQQREMAAMRKRLMGRDARIAQLEHRCECDWYKSCDFYNDEEWSIGHCEECKRLSEAVKALETE